MHSLQITISTSLRMCFYSTEVYLIQNKLDVKFTQRSATPYIMMYGQGIGILFRSVKFLMLLTYLQRELN